MLKFRRLIALAISVVICFAGVTHHALAQGKQKLPDLKKVMVFDPENSPAKLVTLAALVKSYKKSGTAEVNYVVKRGGVCVVKIYFLVREDGDEVSNSGFWYVPVEIAHNRVINLFDEIEPVKRESFIVALIEGFVAGPDLQNALLSSEYFFGCYGEDTSACAKTFNESLGANVFKRDLSVDVDVLKNHARSLLLNAQMSWSITVFGCEKLRCYYDEQEVSVSAMLICEGQHSCDLSTSFSYDALKSYLKVTSPLMHL